MLELNNTSQNESSLLEIVIVYEYTTLRRELIVANHCYTDRKKGGKTMILKSVVPVTILLMNQKKSHY